MRYSYLFEKIKLKNFEGFEMFLQRRCYWLFVILLVKTINGFVPHDLIKETFHSSNNFLKDLLGFVSESYTHEEILKRGLIRSVSKYFHETLPDGHQRINLQHVETEYQKVSRLFYHVYDEYYCHIHFETTIKHLQKNVANVDMQDDTKDYPAAHFDAEK